VTLAARVRMLAVALALAALAALPLACFSKGLAVSSTPKVFRAGAFAIDITPTTFPIVVNGGMCERKATKVVDPLHARCLVLDDGATQIAITVVDSCMIPRALFDKAKALAHAATGIAPERMLMSATHTHSAPSVCAILGSGQDDDYAKFLAAQIAKGIAAAQQRLAPARVGWAVAREPKNVFCRRFLMKPGTARTNPFGGTTNDQAQMNPGYLSPNAIKRTGPVDDAVTVLSLQTPDGKPLALLANYSTHYAGSAPLSGDYFAIFAANIAERIGAKPPFVAMMSNGTSGDANCCDFVHARRTYNRFTVARDVADAALEAYRTIAHRPWASLAMAERRLTLGVRMPTPDELAKAKAYIAANGLDRRKPKTVPEVYALETLYMSQLPPTRELKLQAIRIGDLGITAIPNEVYGSTGLHIKANSPFKPTLNVGLANGAEGYLAPPEQHKLGGYTTWRARSSCLETEAEPKVAAVVLDLLREVAAHRARN